MSINREQITSDALKAIDNHKCVILEWGTGLGKTFAAIQLINKVCDRVYREEEVEATILILVAKTIHKKEWKKELEKWGGIKSSRVTIECYESLKKYKDSTFDIICFDELQHLSDVRKDVLKSIAVDYKLIGLSGTLPQSTKDWFNSNYITKILTVSIADAIDNNILPDPTIYTIPLYFDSEITEVIIKNEGKNLPVVVCSYKERWKYLKRKDIEIRVRCTKHQYLTDLNNQIEYWKKKAKYKKFAETKMLRLGNDRLKWLAEKKNNFILQLQDYLKYQRTITFCASIGQSEVLGKNCIHSKNKKTDDILEAFNNKKIKHITAVNIINEGCNLVDCRIGIFANINSSEIIVKQRFGRQMRHKKPIIILPYYKNTREEELVNGHLEGYNKELIKEITTIKEIKL